MKKLSNFYPHIFAIIGFVLVACIYFYPVLQGKKIYQSDIVQYTGMAKEQNDFRDQTGTEPYWTNAAFGGMPTYQLGAKYPHNYIKTVDSLLRFLPRPADYLFLYFLGFYVLLVVLKTDPLKAFFGAMAFGFSTYLIIILGVGHNAKAHAIAYIPLVVAGVILVFQKRYVVGGLLTMIAAALEIQANHFQMTFYLVLFLLVLSGYFCYKLIREKDFKALGLAMAVFGVAGIFALGSNATNLMATAEYTNFSTRGSNELTIGPQGETLSKNSAMSYDYITEYSYGIAESLNLIAPRLFGGGNAEKLGEKSAVYDLILSVGATPQEAVDFANNAPTYWGDQPIVAAPAYIGAIVFFFFLLALLVEKRRIKYAFLIGALFSLLLSWGKNFPILTDFFIDYFPLYNKFRAVSSIQVILELCVPALAIMGLHSFFKLEKAEQWKPLWKSAAIALGLLSFLALIKSTFSFSTAGDGYYLQAYGELGQPFVEALIQDRKAMFSADLFRSMALITLVFVVLWLFVQEKLSSKLAVVLVGCLMVFDLVFVAKNYVNSSAFVSARELEQPYQATPADLQILQDTTLHFRVFEPRAGMSNARTSYFHKAIGGYSAVKPQRMQQLYDFHIAKINGGVLNMLNVRHIIQTNEQGQSYAIINAFANGNAWFVDNLLFVNSADQEIKALDSLNTKSVAVLNRNDFPIQAKKLAATTFALDSLSSITLKNYSPNHLKYESQNTKAGLAVFSEIYYPKGWKITIDGQEVEMFRVNYVLRALQIPAGKHTVEFKFEPEVITKGSTIALLSSIGMLLLLAAGSYVLITNRQPKAVR